jgi:uncharacterized membrane protein
MFTAVGIFCLVLPGIYLAVAYYPFTFLVIVDRRVGTWAAMEASRRAVTGHWWSVFLMVIISMILVVTGLLGAAVLALGVGLLVTIPLVSTVLAFGVGLLITIPLIVGAFAYAYEDLCGGPLTPEAEPVSSVLPTA